MRSAIVTLLEDASGRSRGASEVVWRRYHTKLHSVDAAVLRLRRERRQHRGASLVAAIHMTRRRLPHHLLHAIAAHHRPDTRHR